MAYKIYTEAKINKALTKKLAPYSNYKLNKRSPHPKLQIPICGKDITFTIPNSHPREEFWANKAKRLAKDLELNSNEYNELIGCKLSGPDYMKLVKEKLKSS